MSRGCVSYAQAAASRVRSRRRAGFAGAWFGAAAVAAFAQPLGEAHRRGLVLSSTLEPTATVTAGHRDGETAALLASHADERVLSVAFTNAGDAVVDGVRITSPIPADLKYVPGSATGPGSQVLYSVDDGRTFGRPEDLTVAAPDGSARRADGADYTHVRWVFGAPLDAGATGIARFRAVPR